MEVNYNDGKWHGWNGGDCPVHPETVVEAFCSVEKEYFDPDYADEFDWSTPGAFRVVKEYKEPREFWVTEVPLFDLDGNISGYSFQETSKRDGEFKVREVIE